MIRKYYSIGFQTFSHGLRLQNYKNNPKLPNYLCVFLSYLNFSLGDKKRGNVYKIGFETLRKRDDEFYKIQIYT